MTEQASSPLLQRYQQFVNLTLDLASTLDLDSLLNRILRVAVELGNAEEASILLYDQHTRRLYFETATNVDTILLQKLTVPEESIAGWVALNRTPQIVNNVQADQRHFEKIDEQIAFFTRSMIAVPLVAKSKLIGVLEVINKKSGLFDDEDLEIMVALASQAAVAIENSRLFQQSDLIAEFVHELRTPLSSISMASFLMKRPQIDDEQRERMAQTIYQETQRLTELSSIFLDLASLESGRAPMHFSHISPRALMEECIQVAQIKGAERNIEVILEAPEALPEIEADHDKLKQALLNFLNNAVKYNRPQGKVWLRVKTNERLLTFSVQDTGVGIPPDQVPQLFTRFFRARNVERSTPGTGLGLSISRRIIEMHGGTVEVESILDTGTTFTIQIPMKQEATAQPPRAGHAS